MAKISVKAKIDGGIHLKYGDIRAGNTYVIEDEDFGAELFERPSPKFESPHEKADRERREAAEKEAAEKEAAEKEAAEGGGQTLSSQQAPAAGKGKKTTEESAPVPAE